MATSLIIAAVAFSVCIGCAVLIMKKGATEGEKTGGLVMLLIGIFGLIVALGLPFVMPQAAPTAPQVTHTLSV